MNPTNSKETADFEELAVVEGNVKGANDSAIANTKVIITDEKGKRIETLTNKWGISVLMYKTESIHWNLSELSVLKEGRLKI